MLAAYSTTYTFLSARTRPVSATCGIKALSVMSVACMYGCRQKYCQDLPHMLVFALSSSELSVQPLISHNPQGLISDCYFSTATLTILTPADLGCLLELPSLTHAYIRPLRSEEEHYPRSTETLNLRVYLLEDKIDAATAHKRCMHYRWHLHLAPH